MDKFILPDQNLSPNFIGSWIIDPLSICDDLVSHFETNKGKQTKGSTGSGQDLENKDSTDISMMVKEIKLPGNEVFVSYFDELFSCYADYCAQWPFLEVLANRLQIGTFNLQRYRKGQHFQKVHTERGSLATLHRVFAWMTYLNDVDLEDGGSTHFHHYGLDIQPRKGLTLIWPSEWTHAHKGNVLRANDKYIITGWMHFPEKSSKA